MRKQICKVIKNYQSPYPDDVFFNKDEIVRITEKESEWSGWIWCIKKDGKARWVPKDYIEIQDDDAKFIQDYNSKELNVFKGQFLTIAKGSHEWIWVIDENKNDGWIPLKNVRIIKTKNKKK